VRWLRNRGLNLTGQLPLVKRQIIRQAMGLQLFE
jgi:2-polyprenyl-6-methoxyphenol hydroxylase-like FAD-dependent oxidoreductase